jgi:hypothetical protein
MPDHKRDHKNAGPIRRESVGLLSLFPLNGLDFAKSHPLRFQNDVGPLVRLARETAETKKRGACRDKVKTQNNTHDEERKQRFFKESHGRLLEQ